MTVFAKREMNVTQWAPLQDRVAELMQATGGSHDVMMFSVDRTATSQIIFLGLPDERMLAAHFPGFVQINRAELPDFLTSLIVREDGFAKLFPDIAAKRRSRRGGAYMSRPA